MSQNPQARARSRSTEGARAGQGAGPGGRPPLTEARKSATRLEIAREAVRLFTLNGVAATTGEEIAAAAGVSVRTLWRYFPTKESCVLPLLTGGLELVTRSLRSWGPDHDLTGLLDDLELGSTGLTADVGTLLTLVRLTRTEPGLRAVWLQTHADTEQVFADVLAARTGLPADDLTLHVQAAMINSALRAAVEHYAFHTTPSDAGTRPGALPDGLIATIRTALRTAASDLHP